jgi:hypothetical protein
VSACEVGASEGLREFLIGGGAVWAGGYTCVLSWESAMLIDIAILSVVMSSRPVGSKLSAVNLLARALASFDSNWEVGKRNNEIFPMRDAIRLIARDEAQGSRAADVTNQLLKTLGWPISEERMSAAGTYKRG